MLLTTFVVLEVFIHRNLGQTYENTTKPLVVLYAIFK